jgi:hypothetical protein
MDAGLAVLRIRSKAKATDQIKCHAIQSGELRPFAIGAGM